ncbi:MAG: hypothetical protein FWE02_00400 [Defluviitaleaceae bacterium]|nr:hypothetical protein [Defluviitaleaceae bacterium]
MQKKEPENKIQRNEKFIINERVNNYLNATDVIKQSQQSSKVEDKPNGNK